MFPCIQCGSKQTAVIGTAQMTPKEPAVSIVECQACAMQFTLKPEMEQYVRAAMEPQRSRDELEAKAEILRRRVAQLEQRVRDRVRGVAPGRRRLKFDNTEE